MRKRNNLKIAEQKKTRKENIYKKNHINFGSKF